MSRIGGMLGRVWRSGGALLPLLPLLVVLDLLIRRGPMAAWTAQAWAVYLLTAGLEALGWYLVLLGTNALHRRRPWLALIAVGFLSGFLVFCVVFSYHFFQEFSAYPTWSDLEFIIGEARHVAATASLFAEYMSVGVLATVFMPAVGVFLYWRWALRRVQQDTLPARRTALSLLGAALVLLLARTAIPHMSHATPVAANAVVSTAETVKYFLTRTKGAYHAAERRAVPTVPPDAGRPNLLLLVHESLGRDRMSLYGYGKPTTPRLEAWRRTEPEALMVFPRAVSNSSNTSISMPTLLTGLAPDASLEQFHDAPMLWHYAEAAGYRTFFFSAQNFGYGNFKPYFYSDPPQTIWTAEPENEVEIISGGGMDDAILMDRVYALLDEIKDEPFCGVIQYNVTHYPFRPGRLGHDPQFAEDRSGRYDNAVLNADILTEQLREWLARNALLRNTVIVLTSDHGESHGTHAAHRTQSYYEEVVAIPLLIYLPETLREQKPELAETLRANQPLRVQNLDLLPTLLELASLECLPASAGVAPLAGQSLARPLDPQRALVVMNNTEVRQWVNEGFSIVRGDQKYIFSERYGEEFFDLRADPTELHSLWPLPGGIPDWVEDMVRRSAMLSGIRSRHCSRVPGCVPLR